MQKERTIMSTLSLISLKCFDQQEGGGDEIYFKFSDNGAGGSGKSSVFTGMDTGDSRLINGSFSFSGSVKVTMYEDDTFSDDYIESITLSSPGHQTAVFDEPGVTYVLDYFIA